LVSGDCPAACGLEIQQHDEGIVIHAQLSLLYVPEGIQAVRAACRIWTLRHSGYTNAIG
jgi:hypothetical protein